MGIKKENVYVTVRMPKTLAELIDRYVLANTHQNRSEFIRDAIREKIRREYPDLFNEILKENGN